MLKLCSPEKTRAFGHSSDQTLQTLLSPAGGFPPTTATLCSGKKHIFFFFFSFVFQMQVLWVSSPLPPLVP